MLALNARETSKQASMVAANQEFTAPDRQQAARQVSSGWDPYEVWQRMIKEPRDRRATEIK